MIWNEYAERLREVLDLEASPIAVTYSMTPADGAIINLTKENSACHGGTWHLGLGPRPTGEMDNSLLKL